MEGGGDIMGGTSHDRKGTSGATSISEVPEKLRVKVRAQSLKQRRDTNKVTELIQELCAWKPLSSSELADLFDMTQTYLSQQYLAKMIKGRKLRYTKPTMPNHPEQRYKAP